jgi:hypothetical protein
MAIGTKPAQASGWDLLRMMGDSSAPGVDTVYHFPGPVPAVVRRPVGDGVSIPMADPFVPAARKNSSSDATRFCASEPLEGDDTRIRCVDGRGRILTDTVLTLAPVPLADATWKDVVDFYTGRDSSLRGTIEGLFSHPASLPRVTDLVADRDGSLWLHRTWYSDPVQRWMRLTPGGALRDTLILTRGRIVHLSGDTLWRSWSNEDGMESVERCVGR